MIQYDNEEHVFLTGAVSGRGGALARSSVSHVVPVGWEVMGWLREWAVGRRIGARSNGPMGWGDGRCWKPPRLRLCRHSTFERLYRVWLSHNTLC